MKTISCFAAGFAGNTVLIVAAAVILGVFVIGFLITAASFFRMRSKVKKLTGGLPSMRSIPSMINGALDEAAKQQEANRNAPEETVTARVIGKRTYVSGMRYTHTNYFVSFELGGGARMELMVPGNEYRFLAEGDSGRLTYKGTQFISFTRS